MGNQPCPQNSKEYKKNVEDANPYGGDIRQKFRGESSPEVKANVQRNGVPDTSAFFTDKP